MRGQVGLFANPTPKEPCGAWTVVVLDRGTQPSRDRLSRSRSVKVAIPNINMLTEEEKSFLTDQFLNPTFGEINMEDQENSTTFSFAPANPQKEVESISEFLAKFPRWELTKETDSAGKKFVQITLKKQINQTPSKNPLT